MSPDLRALIKPPNAKITSERKQSEVIFCFLRAYHSESAKSRVASAMRFALSNRR